MASVNVLNVGVLNAENAPFDSPFQFEVTFECVAPLSNGAQRTAVQTRGARATQWVSRGSRDTHAAAARGRAPPPARASCRAKRLRVLKPCNARRCVR
jgi:hypothetical protein